MLHINTLSYHPTGEHVITKTPFIQTPTFQHFLSSFQTFKSLTIKISKMKDFLRNFLFLVIFVTLGGNADMLYKSYCSKNFECSPDQFCTDKNMCECLPNTMPNPNLQNCSRIACDAIYNSCPNSMNCIQNVCTKFCDMTTNDCR